MKKFSFFLISFTVLFLLSCRENKQDISLEAMDTVNIDLEQNKDLLITARDLDVKPTDPILSDADIIKESGISSVDIGLLLRSSDKLKAGIDFSSMTTNYFNLNEVDSSLLNSSDSAGPLKIVDYGPSGELPIEIRKPTIFVQFNQPMVPVSKLGEPMRENPMLKIFPEVEGIYRWYGTKTLSFEPLNPIHRQNAYLISVSESSRSLYGRELGGTFHFTIESEPLEILSLMFGPGDDLYDFQEEVPPTHSQQILITFNQTLDIDDIRGYLQLLGEEGENFPFTVSRPDAEEYSWNEQRRNRSVLLHVEKELPMDTSYELQLASGFSSVKGASPTEDILTAEFQTVTPFQFLDYSEYSYDFPYDPEGAKNPLYLFFSHPVDSDSVMENLSVSFEGVDLKDHVKTFGSIIRLSDLPVLYDSWYRVLIQKGLKDIYGRNLQLKDGEEEEGFNVEVPEGESFSTLPGMNGLNSLEAQFDPAVIYGFQNEDRGSFHINGEEQDLALDQVSRNQIHYRVVDLKPYLNVDGFGSVNLSWHFTELYRDWQSELREREQKRDMTVQVTDMGITVRYAYNKFLIWVNQISTGNPVAAAAVTIEGSRKSFSAKTDSSGLAVVDLKDGEYQDSFYNKKTRRYDIRLTALKGTDKVDLKVANTQYGGRFGIWTSSPQEAVKSIPRIFLFSDRGLYKPGELVTYRGMDWQQTLGEFTPYEGSHKITILQHKGYERKIISSWTGKSSASGGFYNEIQLADNIEPGKYTIRYERGNTRSDTVFQVAHFRKLSFQVQMQKPDRSFFLGDTVSIPLKASNLAGGALTGTDYSYFWTRKPLDFRPPGERWKLWEFGPRGWDYERTLSSGEGILSSQGMATLNVDTKDHSLSGKTYRYVVEGSVQDIDRQSISTATSVVVHPASWYIGARIGSRSDTGWWGRFVSVDKEILFSMAQVGTDGSLMDEQGTLEVEMIKGSYKAVQQNNVGSRINTRYDWVEETLLEDSVSWKNGIAAFSYTPTSSGSYRLRLKGMDNSDREIITDLSFYVSGGSWVRWAGGNMEDITLEPEKDLYFPGDTARILVKSPLEKGRYLMTIEREGILEERFVDLDPSHPILEIPVKENWVPVMYLTLSSFMPRTAEPSSFHDPDFGKPKGIFGAAALNISTRSRELDLEITADKTVYKPGEKGTITIRVSSQGKPVSGAEVTYLAVDRGVLDIINYHIPDPLKFFYSRDNFNLYGAGDDSRRLLLAPVTYETSNLTGGDGDESKLERRDDFTPLAVFEPYLLSDEKGEVEVEINWPDNLTTYRSTAIALSGQKIGYSEDELYVRNPLNVRTALPRQMRVRDTSFAGVIISNIDDKDHEVLVKVHSNALGLPGEREKTVIVPAGQSREVPFVMEGLTAGKSEVVFTILSDVLREELVTTMLVEEPVIRESMTTTGIVSEGATTAEEGLLIPSLIGEGYGSLQISLDSSQAPFLLDQMKKLAEHKNYDFTFDYLYAAAPAIIAPELLYMMDPALAEKADAGKILFLQIAGDRQMSDGGICSSDKSYAQQSNPYASLVSCHMLQLLQNRGLLKSDQIDLAALYEYLEEFADSRGSDHFKMYLHYLKTLAGKTNPETTDSFLELEDKQGISGYALMGQICHMEGRHEKSLELYQKVKNLVSIGTRGVDIRETYESRAYFDSGYQQLSHLMRLALLAGEGPEMIRRYSTSLDTEKGPRNWIDSQDRLWMAIALSDLLSEEEMADKDFTSRVSLNDKALITESFSGFSSGVRDHNLSLYEQIIPLSAQDKLGSLEFRKEGTGSLFYTTTLNYALPNEAAPARDEGLSVFSQIETLEGDILKGNTLELGGTYRMRIFLNTSKSRGYVNLRVPVPSGAEIVDPSFAVSSSYFDKGGSQSESWKRETMYGDESTYTEEGYIWGEYLFPSRPNQLIFNHEIRYSWDYLYYGQREVSFIFRCTTPGVYPTPPAAADLLFEPEVFGRDRGRLIIVK